MILIKDLHKNFNSFAALKGINLQVKRGEIYGFIGQNGAGKSTTMNILAGLSRPTSGSCQINGSSVAGLQPGRLPLGYLPEDPKFYPWLTARETLEYLADHSVPATRIEELLAWVGLDDAAARRVGGFSRGMKQRLGICAALIRDPELVILDEPSSALDPEGRSEVLRLIRELKEMGKTVFFSTHILSDVERVCDTIGMISGGKMVFEKTMQSLRHDNIVPIFDIRLKTAPTEHITDELATMDNILAISADHERLAVTVEDAGQAANNILSYLLSKDLVIESFQQRQNKLEDIFIREVNGK